jgi:hypothetical protein
MKREKIHTTGPEIDLERVDEWLRPRLDPSPDRVNRMVRRALVEKERSRPETKKPSWRPAAAVSAAVATLALALVLLLPKRSHPPFPVPAGNGSKDIAATITNESGEVELRLHAGAKAGIEAFPSPASRIEPSAALINQNGMVMARVTEGGVRYIVIGGRT